MNAQVFRSVNQARDAFGPCAVAIGNFDGVHIGHQALMARMLEGAGALHVKPAALTFDPHPATIVAPERVPEMICTLEERLELLAACGAEQILVLPFTAEVARLSPREFVGQILWDTLRTRGVFVGENFHFGYRQAGTPETLRELGRQFGFESHFVPPVASRGETVSSSLIRRYLRAGRVSRAARLLNRCFTIEGPVVHGRGIGSKELVPTLNLKPAPGLVVPLGIYVTETFDDISGRRWPSITYCGNNPTFGGTDLTVETFLLDPLEGGTPAAIEVHFRLFLRAEETFENVDLLRDQILRDVARAKTYWKRAPSIY